MNSVLQPNFRLIKTLPFSKTMLVIYKPFFLDHRVSGGMFNVVRQFQQLNNLQSDEEPFWFVTSLKNPLPELVLLRLIFNALLFSVQFSFN